MRFVKLLRFGLSIFIIGFSIALLFTPKVVFAGTEEIAIMSLMNSQRSSLGLKPLLWNEKLALAARVKSVDMITDGYWSHTSPDGKTPWFFMKQAGYKYRSAGENLARGFDSASATVNAWMNSEGHKANILSVKYKETGVAIVSGKMNGVDTKLVVAMYGMR